MIQWTRRLIIGCGLAPILLIGALGGPTFAQSVSFSPLIAARSATSLLVRDDGGGVGVLFGTVFWHPVGFVSGNF